MFLFGVSFRSHLAQDLVSMFCFVVVPLMSLFGRVCFCRPFFIGRGGWAWGQVAARSAYCEDVEESMALLWSRLGTPLSRSSLERLLDFDRLLD